MRWYGFVHQSSLLSNQIEEISDKLSEIGREWGSLEWESRRGTISDSDLERKNDLEKDMDILQKKFNDLEKIRSKRIEENKNNPHLMTSDDFVSYHKTGTIPSSSYERYKEDLSWIGSIDKYPVLLKTKDHDGEIIEYRQSGDPIRYLKTDENKIFIRGPNDELVYLSPEEVEEKGLNKLNTSIYAFNEDKEPIGFASDEFGADGVWVLGKYQRKGIGLELLDLLRSQFPQDRKMGQMTIDGEGLAKRYHKLQVEKALGRGETVPDEVLEDLGIKL